MGYSIDAQSPNEVENIRQRVNLQKQVKDLDQNLKKNSAINPYILNLLQKNLEGHNNLDEIHRLNEEHQKYIEAQLDNILVIVNKTLFTQTDLDEIYKYVKNNRSSINKKLNTLKKQVEEQQEIIKEQNKKIDKLIELLEKIE